MSSFRRISTFDTLTPKQLEANALLASARHVLLRGGARSGKTFLIVRAIITRALKAPGSRHGIFRFRFNALRASIWLDTLPKVLRICFPGLVVKQQRQDGYVELPNGSQIWFCGLDEKERVEKILGMEFATLYFNESSQIPYASIIMALTRLAQLTSLVNRAFFDCNPPSLSHWTHDLFKKKVTPGSRMPLPDPNDYREMAVNPIDNRQNLDPKFLASLDGLPARQRQRFLIGEWTADVEGALWTLENIDRNRIDTAPDLRRIVVAIDPPAKAKEGNDDCGIIVSGEADGHLYVLEDLSLKMASPAMWGRAAVMAYHKWRADRIVAEVNQGGDMVEAVIRHEDANVPVTQVHATRGKYVRAEPIAALYEQNKAHHVGLFPELEDEMTTFTVSGLPDGSSPDHLDALVWAATDLMGVADHGLGIG